MHTSSVDSGLPASDKLLLPFELAEGDETQDGPAALSASGWNSTRSVKVTTPVPLSQAREQARCTRLYNASLVRVDPSCWSDPSLFE